ncbi:MAG: metallophosphoesterase family protein [Elainellaceae cyanobacterium]
MTLRFRFAIASDLHIALPHTIPDNPYRFHRVEISIPALEQTLDYLAQLDIDFLLLPGDLTQDGERDNHQWLAERLTQLPYPVYVVPGNHDFLERHGGDRTISVTDFPRYYAKFGYQDTDQLYYTHLILPEVRLIGLNSVFFGTDGRQIYMGRMDDTQLLWLEQTLAANEAELVMVMIHHNVIEHLPGQMQSPLGRRYMLQNAPDLLAILERYGVNLIFTGHLHVQDVARSGRPDAPIYDIVTGSLVSYPHPFRILNYRQEAGQRGRLQIESKRIQPDTPALAEALMSREFVGDRSQPLMLKLLTSPPLHLSPAEAATLLPHLRYFWADLADGDAQFQFPQLPSPVRQYFEQFSAEQPIDNHAILEV